MLERLVETRWPISAILSDEKVTKRVDRSLDMKNEQWDLAKELLAPLKQIETATVYISEEEKASISSVLPILYGIIDNLNIKDEDAFAIKEFKTVVTESIKRRWSLNDLCPILALSAVLDARFKQLKFLGDQKRAVIDALTSNVTIMAEDQVDDIECNEQESSQLEVENVEDPAISSTTDSQAILDEGGIPVAKRSKKSALDVLLGPEECQEMFTIQDELDMYLQVKPPSRKVNIFEWWKINEPRYPNIAKLAKSMLCVPATSTAAEQVFSAAGITVSKRRSCLKPENVDKILFLNKNLPLLSIS